MQTLKSAKVVCNESDFDRHDLALVEVVGMILNTIKAYIWQALAAILFVALCATGFKLVGALHDSDTARTALASEQSDRAEENRERMRVALDALTTIVALKKKAALKPTPSSQKSLVLSGSSLARHRQPITEQLSASRQIKIPQELK